MVLSLSPQKTNRHTVARLPRDSPAEGTSWASELTESLPKEISTKGWRVLRDHLGNTDHTDTRIICGVVRPDIQIMKVDRTIPAKASRNIEKPQSNVFFLGFGSNCIGASLQCR